MTPGDKEGPPEDAAPRAPFAGLSDETGTGVIKHETIRLAPGQAAPGPGSQSASTDRRGSATDAFQPGDLVSDRYRIIRFIARGGMGEVYEAEDLEFSGSQGHAIERVALKTVRMDMADRDDSIQRFRLEILHSRKVSHPNVSRIFESGRHRIESTVPGQPPTEILYFTMELLVGETLRERIKRLGKMTTTEALPIVVQMASGLATAHAAGVVHRDFKSSNVFLVSGPSGERAVVTDFGLARGEVDESSLASLTGTGDTLGTLSYMAPEQIGRSKGARPTVDIYALGVVMYEMVTADIPHQDMMSKVSRPAPSPRALVAGLDPIWERVIMRCLERKPEDRFENAMDVVLALGGQPVAVGRTKERRMYIGAGIAVAVALALAGGYYFALQGSTATPADIAGSVSPSVEPAKAVPIRRSVAVLGFQPPLGETGTGWISTALMDLVSGGLEAGNQLRVVPVLQVARVKADIGVGDLSTPSGGLLTKLRQALPAEIIVSGAYSFIGDGAERVLRVEMRLESPAAPGGETWTVSGSEKEIADLASRASETLREKLGTPKLLPAAQNEVAARLPSEAATRKKYAEALDHLGRGDAATARPLLELVAVKDPKHVGAQIALAAAWGLQGNQPKAAAASARALTLAGGASPHMRLLLEARDHEINRNWKGAIAGYETLRSSFPDDPEYLLYLVEAQMLGGKTRDALAALHDFRKLPKSVSDDPRIDLAEARAYARLSAHKEVQTAAARAAQKGAALGSSRIVANGKLLEAVALDGLGESDKSQEASEEARKLFEASNDRQGIARALVRIGIALQQKRGDPKGSMQALDTALGLFREVGDRLSESRVLFSMGTVLMAQGRDAEAAKRTDEALAIARQIGAKAEAASALNNLGSRLLEHGDLAGAQSRYQQALGLYTELGEKRLTALTLTNLGEVLFARGDLKKSRDSHEEALGMNRQLGDAAGAAYDKYRIAEVLVQTGDLNEAEKRYRESIKETEAEAASETRIRLAALLTDAGRPAEGEKEAREVEETLRVQGAADLALWAQIVVVDSVRAQGKVKEAKADLEKILPMVEKSGDNRVRHSALLARSRIVAAGQEKTEAERVLQALVVARQEAVKSGRVIDEYELRLASAELGPLAGKPAAGSGPKKLAIDSRARGLLGIAKKAEARIR